MAIDLYPLDSIRVGHWVRLPDGQVGKLVDNEDDYYVDVGGLVREVHPTTWVEDLGWEKPEAETPL